MLRCLKGAGVTPDMGLGKLPYAPPSTEKLCVRGRIPDRLPARIPFVAAEMIRSTAFPLWVMNSLMGQIYLQTDQIASDFLFLSQTCVHQESAMCLTFLLLSRRRGNPLLQGQFVSGLSEISASFWF